MGNSESSPSQKSSAQSALKCQWKEAVAKRHSDDVRALHVKSRNFLYIAFFNSNESFFLVRKGSFLSAFVHEYLVFRGARRELSNALTAGIDTAFQSPAMTTLEFGNSGAAVIHQAVLLRENENDWAEIPFECLAMGIYSTDIAHAIQNWLHMIRNHAEGPLAPFADRWLAGDQGVQQMTPSDSEMERTLRLQRREIEKECADTLERFVEKSRSTAIDVFAVAEAASVVYSRAEVVYIPRPEDDASGTQQPYPKEQYVTLQVPIDAWAALEACMKRNEKN